MRTTGIGSLPFTEPAEALAYSLAHDLPFLPELPKLDPAEFMIPAALAGVATGRPELHVLERFLAGVPSPRLLKLQLAGPTTLAAFSRELPRDAIAPWLVLRVRAMIAAAQARGHEVLFVLDEPALVAHPPFALDVVTRAIREAGARVGLHCCGETDWHALLPLGLDALSFDARLSLDSVLRAGFSGQLIAGVDVPTPLPAGVWVSTPCGLAMEPPGEAWRRLELLRALAVGYNATP
ncbi:MAG: hypothetical protein ACOZQL_29000 [Myxococcota bacterium]